MRHGSDAADLKLISVEGRPTWLFDMRAGDEVVYFPEGHMYASCHAEAVMAYRIAQRRQKALYGPVGDALPMVYSKDGTEPARCQSVHQVNSMGHCMRSSV